MCARRALLPSDATALKLALLGVARMADPASGDGGDWLDQPRVGWTPVVTPITSRRARVRGGAALGAAAEAAGRGKLVGRRAVGCAR